MAALSTAYQLSRTDALRAAYDVTVYTLGWRLGGKCATGRDRTGRICEHGLHFWFGCYENAFRMLRDVYAAWRPPVAREIETVVVSPWPAPGPCRPQLQLSRRGRRIIGVTRGAPPIRISPIGSKPKRRYSEMFRGFDDSR